MDLSPNHNDMIDDRRRTFLKTAGAAAIGTTLSGCLGGGREPEGQENTPTESTDRPEQTDTDDNSSTSTPENKGQRETGSTGDVEEFDYRELLQGLPQIKEINASGTQIRYSAPAGIAVFYDRVPEQALNYKWVKNSHLHGLIEGANPGEEVRGMATIRPRLSGHEVIEMDPEEIYNSIKENENTEVEGDKDRALVKYDDPLRGKKHFEYLVHLQERGPQSTNVAFALKQEFEGEEDAMPVEEPGKNLDAAIETLNGNAPHLLEDEEYKEANQIHYDVIEGEEELPEFLRDINPPEAVLIAPAQYVARQGEKYEMTTGGEVGTWFGNDNQVLWKGYRMMEDGNVKEAGTSQSPNYLHEV